MSLFSGSFSCPVWVRKSCKFSNFFNIHFHNLYINFSSVCINLLFELFFVQIANFYVSFGFSSRWFSFWGLYKFTFMRLSGVLLYFVHCVKCWITFCAVTALYWSFRSLIRNYLLNRDMNSVVMDFKLVFCAFFNLAIVTSKTGGTLKYMNWNLIDLSTFMILCYLVWLGVLAG